MYKRLTGIAKDMRGRIMKMLYEAGSGHPGASLSASDIVTALFFEVMRHNPKDPNWDKRDRFF